MSQKSFQKTQRPQKKGVTWAFWRKNQTLPDIARAMVKLKVGETSSVIESTLGFHIIKLASKKKNHAVALDEVKPEILNHLLKLETEKKLKSYLSGLRKKSEIKIFI